MLSPLAVLITRGWETKLKLGVAGEQGARCMLLALLVGVTFLAVCFPSPSSLPLPKGNIISSFRNTHRKWVSICWLLASNRALTGGERGCSCPRLPRFIWTFLPEDLIQDEGTEGFCTEGVRGNGSLCVILRLGDSGALVGSAGTWLPPRRFLLTSQRPGCLLKINAHPAANNDSFAMNHFQKWIATVFWNDCCEIPRL